jgi:hypothetical protein
MWYRAYSGNKSIQGGQCYSETNSTLLYVHIHVVLMRILDNRFCHCEPVATYCADTAL